ncbi:response regulator transcription factor [Kitasatospora sp. NPDC088346]|uniref:response regulator transcription factor n=1 Tax=Kitasatospora sp. NPDC088346 TaxID=3364073 RepID=UPI0037F3C4EE
MAAASPLTAREQEIAWLAARGGTSRSVAEGLHLSVRTVENHLQNIYGKHGISGRAELADALGRALPSPERGEDHDA